MSFTLKSLKMTHENGIQFKILCRYSKEVKKWKFLQHLNESFLGVDQTGYWLVWYDTDFNLNTVCVFLFVCISSKQWCFKASHFKSRNIWKKLGADCLYQIISYLTYVFTHSLLHGTFSCCMFFKHHYLQ